MPKKIRELKQLLRQALESLVMAYEASGETLPEPSTIYAIA
jgi:hypothetical protein